MVSTANIRDYKSITLYPNPSSDMIYIDGDFDTQANLDYRILDVTGKLIAFDKFKETHQHSGRFIAMLGN